MSSCKLTKGEMPMSYIQTTFGRSFQESPMSIQEVITELPETGTGVCVEGRLVTLQVREFEKTFQNKREGTEVKKKSYSYSGGIYNEEQGWDATNTLGFNFRLNNTPVPLQSGMYIKVDGFIEHRKQKDTIEPVLSVLNLNLIIEGKIMELTEKKEGNLTCYTGVILDPAYNWNGNHSIAFRYEVFEEHESLTVDTTVRLTGWLKPENGSNIFNVYETQKWDNLPTVITDEAEEKRVELTSVGAYSLQTSSVTPQQYIEFAKQLGHQGIAITDINSAQGFPEAYQAAKKADLKVVLGMKLMVSPPHQIVFGLVTKKRLKDETFVILDVETTGLANKHDFVIEIGAVKVKDGKIIARFQCFLRAPKAISPTIYNLTKITQEMSDNGLSQEEAWERFREFIEGSILVAHNADFDLGMLKVSFQRVGIPFHDYTMIDTLGLSRAINKTFKRHNLKTLSKHYGIDLVNHHRADADAEATARMFLTMLDELEEMGIQNVNQIPDLMDDEYYQKLFGYEVTLLAQNFEGIRNIYKLVTLAHSTHMGSDNRPKVPLYVLQEHREGLLIGSGSSYGLLFETALNKTSEEVAPLVSLFDYIEIEPAESALYRIRTEEEEKELQAIHAWNTIVAEGEKQGKAIVAVGNTHYLTPSDKLAQHVLIYNQSGGSKQGSLQAVQGNRHYRTTSEMLASFPWLPEEKRREYVITNSNKIFDMCEMTSPIPEGFFPPEIPGADEKLRQDTYNKAHNIYGNPLPDYVEARIQKELKSIIGHGFTVIYSVSQDLIEESLRQGYLVGSRGSVGSSFVAFCTNISEVNPLKPHYACPTCKKSKFFDTEELQSGFDLPRSLREFLTDSYNERTKQYVFEQFEQEFGENTLTVMENHNPNTCPWCGEKGLLRDGTDIPFETFLGFKGDKVPDIDLNFSGEYQPYAHEYIGKRLGEENCYRAGTISTVADKTAFGYAKKYQEEQGLSWSNAEASRLAHGMTGAKRTTGQHPGGIIALRKGMSITDFGGANYPANDKTSPMMTTHFAYTHIHDNLAKFDILGHDDPTVLYLLKQWTGVDPRSVDITDPKVLALFGSPQEAMGIDLQPIDIPTGTLGVPEFGTEFVMKMIVDTKPKTYAQLVKISGLSHGTDVWLGNAEVLIKKGICELKDVIDTRDNIMVYLIQKGLEESLAFKIMESVRKGKGVQEEWQEIMRAHDVPEWYINSCILIKYMFPKAHAAAYVLSALRIAWFKVYYPAYYYAAQFSVRWTDTPVLEVLGSAADVRTRIEELKEIIQQKDSARQPTTNEKSLITVLKNLYEAKVRGVEFGNIRLYGSSNNRWMVQEGKIIPPFVSIPGVGGEAAKKLELEAKRPFTSVADLKKRTSVSETVLGTMEKLKLLGLVEVKNHTFF